MHMAWRSSMLILGAAVGCSQAGQPASHHLLRRIPQAYDIPPPIIPISSTVHSGNTSAVNPSHDTAFPTSTPHSMPLPVASGQSSDVSHDAGRSTETSIETSLDETYVEVTQSTTVRSSQDLAVTLSTSQSDVTEAFSATSYDPGAFQSSENLPQPSWTSTGEGSEDIPSLSPEFSGNPETTQTSFTVSQNSDSMTGTWVQSETSVTSEILVSMSSETISKSSEPGTRLIETYTSSGERESQVQRETTVLGDATSSPISSAMREPSEAFDSSREATESIENPVTSDEPAGSTTVPITVETSTPALTGAGDMLVTGTGGIVATYVPEQDSDYASLTGTITTTDENGDDIIIFPFGWFWRLDGGRGGAGAVQPPAPTINPAVVNQPDEKEGNKNEDEDEDEEASTKDENKSTVESTAYSTTEDATTTTTQEPETTTSTEECTAMTQPDCTRTISYMTSDGTQIMTEFGDCPTVVSCATEAQTTATVTLSELIWAGGAIETPMAVIPEDALTKEVDPDILDALEEEWARIFDQEDGLFPGFENDTDTTVAETATTDATTDNEAATTETSISLTATVTTESGSSIATTTPSTLITMTRGSSDSPDLTSTAVEAPRTYFPCVIHGGPAVDTPYCQCSTTVDGQGYYATTTLVDNKCVAYTTFPSQITSAPPSGPITEGPVQEPITTTTDGTILVWSAYVLDYINIPGVTRITQSVGVGEPSTVSTPLPSQTAVDNDGGGQCGTADSLSKRGLREACDRAIGQFEDDVVYTGYTSRYSRLTKGILMTASFGKAACVAKFECDDYGIGMAGSDIKAARESAKENDGVGICGHIYLSNSCKVVMDYCTNCKSRG